MDDLIQNDNYIIDLSYATSASDIVFELSSIIDNEMAKNQKIGLILGDIDLNQSQLLSIYSLIKSINSTIAILETKSEQTEQSAINLGIVVTKDMQQQSSQKQKVEDFIQESTYTKSYGYVTLEEHIDTIENPKNENFLEEQEEILTENNNEDEIENKENDFILKEEIVEDSVISEEQADEIKEAKNEDIQDALNDIFDTEVKLEAILDNELQTEDGTISEAQVKQALESEANYTEDDFEIDQFPTKYIKQTLRSGQIVNYEGNVVIIGDCHPGSEIIASGDITVWGILSGIAHAGANGNQRARVRALKMNAIQLRIGGCFARKPDGMNTIFPERTSTFTPEEARVINNEIIIFKIND